jgi:hypothetical protein
MLQNYNSLINRKKKEKKKYITIVKNIFKLNIKIYLLFKNLI